MSTRVESIVANRFFLRHPIPVLYVIRYGAAGLLLTVNWLKIEHDIF